MPIILFRCPGCNARIKAPTQLLGHRRECPGCRTGFVVRPEPLEDAGPVLVTDTSSARRRPAFR